MGFEGLFWFPWLHAHIHVHTLTYKQTTNTQHNWNIWKKITVWVVDLSFTKEIVPLGLQRGLTQFLRALASLAEDQVQFSASTWQRTTVHNCSSREMEPLVWPLWALQHTGAVTYTEAIHSYTLCKSNLKMLKKLFSEFWLGIRRGFPLISEMSLIPLLSFFFFTMDLCGRAFLPLMIIKSNHWSIMKILKILYILHYQYSAKV